jgi:hypothetical protein
LVEKIGNSYSVFMENPGGRISLGRSQHKWKNNTKMYLNETDGMTLNGLVWFKTGTS